MYFLIISGMSGAGKSRAVATLEDLGYYCVDNLPIALIPRFAEVCLAATERYERVALVTDVRAGGDFQQLFDSLDSIRDMGCDYRILFLDTDTATGAAFEVIVQSFGFKYGIPPESDLVFDVRFLPNPYYEMSLRERNGTDPEVRDYVFQGGTADVLMRHLTTLIDFLLPRYSASICAAVNTALSPCIEIIRDKAPVCGAPQKWSQNTCHFLPKSKTSCAAFP